MRKPRYETVVFVESGVNAVITLPPANYHQTSPRLLYRDNNRLSISYMCVCTYTRTHTASSRVIQFPVDDAHRQCAFACCESTLYMLRLFGKFLFGQTIETDRPFLVSYIARYTFFYHHLKSSSFINDTIIDKLENLSDTNDLEDIYSREIFNYRIIVIAIKFQQVPSIQAERKGEEIDRGRVKR